MPVSKVQFPSRDRKAVEKNKDCVWCFTLLAWTSTFSKGSTGNRKLSETNTTAPLDAKKYGF